MFLLIHKLPFSLITPLIASIQAVAGDSKIARHLKCARTKSTTVTNTIIQEEGAEDVAKDIRKWKFSIIIDETTDITTKKCLAVLVRYFDVKACAVRDRFLSLIELTTADAQTIYGSLLKLFSDLRVPIENCVGFASDNASVMMGKTNGVQALLKEKIPTLFVLGCVCHSLHLCSSAASKKLPRAVERLTRNIYSYFCHSSKRLFEFKELQELYNVKTHKLLKTASTRWFSLESVVNRVLEQWKPLSAYFLVCDVNDDSADLGCNISQALNAKNKAYLHFVSYILRLTNVMNLEFQAERPRIHFLLKTTRAFLKTVLMNFVKADIVNAAKYLMAEYENELNWLADDDVYVGANVQACFQTEQMPAEDIIEIKKMCRSYYIELVRQVLTRINVHDTNLKSLEIISPAELGQSICPLLLQFPNMGLDGVDFEDIDMEWRSVIQQELVPQNLDLESFWGKIFELKNGINKPMYPLLKRFVGSMLALPHRSACAERIFSKVALIKNKVRYQLEVPTVCSIMLAAGMIA